MERPIVKVNQKAATRVASGHPWIFSSDVVDRGAATPGSSVTVIDTRGRPLGTADYSSTSQISLRLLSHRVEPIDKSWLTRKIEAALDLRRRLVADTDACRLVYGEADGLPGLVVDRYAGCLVLQALDQAMDRRTPVIVECLQALLSPAAIVARNDVPVRSKEDLALETKVLAGELPQSLQVRINGLVFNADLLQGQKTGIYLDQRENYRAAAHYARGHALDCVTSTGGFALHLAPRVESVEAVDSSAAALSQAEANRIANGLANIHFREADVFELLAGYAAAGRRFSTIVLDPPAFAKSRGALDGAVRGYKEINLRALKLLEPGGVLVTCSCSHHLSEAMFLELLAEASLDAGRPLRILERRTQAQDHPILLTVPETHYLKCLILEAA
jgi:23S rRNA (cytosine1962-C5)-methyltransferase